MAYILSGVPMPGPGIVAGPRPVRMGSYAFDIEPTFGEIKAETTEKQADSRANVMFVLLVVAAYTGLLIQILRP
jgi:hypothetical protein